MISDRPDWVARSVTADTAMVDVYFTIADSFYVGDPNDSTQLHDPAFRRPLPPPGFLQAVPAFASTREIEGHEPQLAEYYARILREHRRSGRPYQQNSHHFWMRLFFRFTEEEAITFPWYDTRAEMTPLFGWLRSAEDGQTWWDMDQGWELTAIRLGDRFYFRGTDGERDAEEWLNVSTPRSLLLQEIDAADRRLVAIISVLTSRLGADHWSTRRRESPPSSRTDLLRKVKRWLGQG